MADLEDWSRPSLPDRPWRCGQEVVSQPGSAVRVCGPWAPRLSILFACRPGEEGERILAEILLANGLAEESGCDAALFQTLPQQREEQLLLARIGMGLVADRPVLSRGDHPASDALQRLQPDCALGRILVVIGGQAGLTRLRRDLWFVQELRLLGQRVGVVPLFFEQPDSLW